MAKSVVVAVSNLAEGNGSERPENEIYFYSMCAHELNLSSLYVSDDSIAKISTKTLCYSWSTILAKSVVVAVSKSGRGNGSEGLKMKYISTRCVPMS